jgi:hypothetical protein
MFFRTMMLSFLMLLTINAIACDVCGCSVSSNGIGLLSAYQYNTAGIRWQSVYFRQNPTLGTTKDHFESLELYFQWHPMEHLRLSVFQPYKWHYRYTEQTHRQVNGLGDTRLLANYAIFKNAKPTDLSTLFWELGAGIKLPTGKYDARIHRTGLPENFNIGNGSWAYIFQSNVVYNLPKIGIASFTTYQHNLVSKSDYHFGSQLSSSLSIFAQNSFTKTFKTIPHAGLYVEHIAADKLYNANEAHGTGGYGLFASGGINFVIKDILISSSVLFPITGNYGETEIEAKPRFALELAYIF